MREGVVAVASAKVTTTVDDGETWSPPSLEEGRVLSLYPTNSGFSGVLVVDSFFGEYPGSERYYSLDSSDDGPFTATPFPGGAFRPSAFVSAFDIDVAYGPGSNGWHRLAHRTSGGEWQFGPTGSFSDLVAAEGLFVVVGAGVPKWSEDGEAWNDGIVER